MRSNAQLPLFESEIPTRRKVAGRKQKVSASLLLRRNELVSNQLEQLVERYDREAHAERTRKVYQADWNAFERWCVGRGEQALPASVDTVRRYLAYLAGELGRKASTIRRARCSIGQAHAHAGLPRPDCHARVRTLERGIARLHGAHEEGADPLLPEHLARVVGALGATTRDVRDRAIILLGFAGAYRSNDLVALRIEGLTFSAGGLRVFLPRSKEDQRGEGAYTDIPFGACTETCPVQALRAWIDRVDQSDGPLFRVVVGARVGNDRVSTRCVSRAVQRAAMRAGLVGNFSSHSLRSGLATSAYASGATEREIQAHGRWKDRRSLDRYIHVNRMPGRKNVAAGLL